MEQPQGAACYKRNRVKEAKRMIEQVLNRRNTMRAIRQVVSNKGSAGVDGITAKELQQYWTENRERIESEIRAGKYQPQPIRMAEIPKGNGKMRTLGIPVVLDRMLQQAVAQVIAIKFEMEFDDYSYGFRPNRNAQQAILKAQEYINDDYQDIVDIDLKTFFDEVDHCILLQLLYRKIKCPLTLRLIRKWLRAPMMTKEGKLIKRRKGVPQGSPLSPLLSNIMLNELDKEMRKQELRFVRYADDFSIYVKGKQNARNIGNNIYMFLKNKLKLPINREKSGIRRPTNFTILGCTFASVYEKGVHGKYQVIVSEKSWKKLKEKLKAITRKTTSHSIKERIRQLKEVQRGWIGYFRLANIKTKLETVDSWVRNRLRYCIWHDWKNYKRRRKNFIQLGVEPKKARGWSGTRMGGWAVAQSPIMITTITNERLNMRGYESMLNRYVKVAPHLNEPLYTRPVRTVV